jgi:hypothetical protein
MRVIAGKYTLVLTTFVCGFLLLLNWFLGIDSISDLWMYSPYLLVILGIETIVLKRFNYGQNLKIEIGMGNLILIACVVAGFMLGTASIDIDTPVIDNLSELSSYVLHKI